MNVIRIFVILLLVFVFASAGAGTVSTFDLNNEGWMIADPAPTSHFGSQTIATIAAPWDGLTGQPPGSLQADDTNGFTWDWVAAPGGFLGDQSVEYGSDIEFDIRLGTGPSLNPGPAVALQGSSITLFYNMAPTSKDVWTTRLVPLTETGWVVDDYLAGSSATQANLMAVLSDLQGFYILTEWRAGNDFTDVDNIRFGTVVPVPASAWFLGSALGLLAWLRRRRSW